MFFEINCISPLVTIMKMNRYLVNPNMEVVRCFGVEYNAEELSEAILKDVNRTGTQQTRSQ